MTFQLWMMLSFVAGFLACVATISLILWPRY